MVALNPAGIRVGDRLIVSREPSCGAFALREEGERATMEALVSVGKLESKSHREPDEVRAPAKTRVEVVRLQGFTLGRLRFEPGWRWSECVKPVAGTNSCQVSHVGYCVSGALTIRMEDGTELDIRAGDSYTIPPGHDAWVVGTEPVVAIEVLSAEQFAKAAT